MQISLKWIDELINLKTVDLDFLIKKLTLGGFEVEEVIEIQLERQEDIALNLSATANRSDSLSIQNFSLEIASLLNKKIKKLKYPTKNFNWEKMLKNSSQPVDNNNICSAFISLTVKNVTNCTSPIWIKQRLLSSGLVPENTLNDFQKYILLETGHPLEFYDLNKIYSKIGNENFNLSLTNGENEKNFNLNQDLTHKLTNSIVTINANKFPISIAGLISDQKVIYSESTTSLLIEGSVFNATKIRQQSRMVRLRTDRGARYEKSIKDSGLSNACYRLISLLRLSNPNLTCQLHTVGEGFKPVLLPISLKYETIKNVLGPSSKSIDSSFVTPKLITQYLNQLNFHQTYDESTICWKVKPTYLRSDDITREIDLIEEIGRLHGFNKFFTQLPMLKLIGNKDSSYQTRKKLISCLTNIGLTELIHYSIVNPKLSTSKKIKLLNPLIKDHDNLRSSLLPNLVQTVQSNLKQQSLIFEIFECGHIFFGESIQTIQEKEVIAGILGNTNRKVRWSEPIVLINWFEAKGKIEQLFHKLNIRTYWTPCHLTNYLDLLHPFRSSELKIDQKFSFGVFGQINPILAKKLNISLDIFLFEFDLKLIQIQTQVNRIPVYHEYSSYPKIIKNLSCLVSENVSFQKIKELLHFNGSKLLKKINLLDEYRDPSFLDKNYKSLCFQLIFQSNEKTLESKKVDQLVSELQSLLTQHFDLTIRT